jgi:hypothetical protein
LADVNKKIAFFLLSTFDRYYFHGNIMRRREGAARNSFLPDSLFS